MKNILSKFCESLDKINKRKRLELRKLLRNPGVADAVREFADEVFGCLNYLCNYDYAIDGNGKKGDMADVQFELGCLVKRAYLKTTGKRYETELVRTANARRRKRGKRGPN